MTINKTIASIISLAFGLGMGCLITSKYQKKGVGTWDGISNVSGGTSFLKISGNSDHIENEVMLHIRYYLCDSYQFEMKSFRDWMAKNVADNYRGLVNELKNYHFKGSLKPLNDINELNNSLPEGWRLDACYDHYNKIFHEKEAYIDLIYRHAIPTNGTYGVTLLEIDQYMEAHFNGGQVDNGVKSKLQQHVDDPAAKKILGL